MPMPFTVRVFKAFASRANKTWVNTYEFDVLGAFAEGQYPIPLVPDALSPSIVSDAIQAVVSFEKAIHLENIHFIYATGSSWEPDSDPYDPEALITVPLTGVGTRTPGLPMEPELGNIDLRNVVVAYRFPTYGKLGKAEYRGCLDENDVISGGGRFELNPEGDFETQFVAAHNTHLSPIMTGAETGAPRLVMIGGTLLKEVVEYESAGQTLTKFKRTYIAPYHVRFVNLMTIGKIGVRKLDNKSFDRP
jgi:hypothetical protein